MDKAESSSTLETSSKVVLISGKAGAGKSTLAKKIIERLESSNGVRAVNFKFAESIYAMHDYCLGYLKTSKVEVKTDKDGELLQLLGLWGREKYGENVWVGCAKARLSKLETNLKNAFKNLFFINDDTRFKNELEAFPNALRIRLECYKDARKARCHSWRDNEMHPSEIDLDDWVFAPGKFDMIFNTNVDSPDHCATLILAQLDKNVWLEKRNNFLTAEAKLGIGPGATNTENKTHEGMP